MWPLSPSELKLSCSMSSLLMSRDVPKPPAQGPHTLQSIWYSSPPADHEACSTHEWPWRPKILYLLSLTTPKWHFTQAHPLWYLLQLLLCQCSWHFRCMECLRGTFHFPSYARESRASAPMVFGILRLTQMLLIPSLGFTLKGKMRALRPDLWFFSLTRRAFLSYASWNFLAVDLFTPISVPSYRFPDAVQAEMSALGLLRKIMLFSSKPGICKNQKCLLSDYKTYPSFKSKANASLLVKGLCLFH